MRDGAELLGKKRRIQNRSTTRLTLSPSRAHGNPSRARRHLPPAATPVNPSTPAFPVPRRSPSRAARSSSPSRAPRPRPSPSHTPRPPSPSLVAAPSPSQWSSSAVFLVPPSVVPRAAVLVAVGSSCPDAVAVLRHRPRAQVYTPAPISPFI